MFLGVFIVNCIRSLHCFFTCFYFSTDFNIVFRVLSFHQLSSPWLFFVRYVIFGLLYHKCYELEGTFFIHRHFLPFFTQLLLSSLPWDLQFCLEGCRASHPSSKHRFSPSVCLNHSVQQKVLVGSIYVLRL